MSLTALVAPLAGLLDKLIPDPAARDAAKLQLLALENGQELERLRAQLSAMIAEAQSADPWTARARPSFLYVMYALLLWSIPMGLIAAVRPAAAEAIARGMVAYLGGLPEPLYALFGTGYLGYTVARSWGKVKGVER
ncbi:holin family protein [Sphingomonas rubra]|uniref:Holin of 3TMs, for gene-transfer release n=1 Tax=Sphingomonas rubra TaxID=634430 RepID=A0A1I5S8W8_9SPHN|nr:holin family protein [Sphingomonas rubra]SFP67161.1 Holin of 3TMs, for gene-transfer release [Sphingomonas rubra]